MYLGSWTIDDLLTFTVQTQVFATGVATDADAAPAYRVFEDETGTPIINGSMALLDSANTNGFYSEQITLSAANGFEKGKSYSIRIEATVSGVVGATVRTFQMEAEVDANLSTAIADIDTLVNAIKLKTDNLPSDPADASDIAGLLSTLSAAVADVKTYIDTEVLAIKAKTDNLPTDPADASDIAGLLSAISAAIADVKTYVDTEILSIKSKTDALPNDPADASDISSSFGLVNSTLAAISGFIDTEIAAIKAKTDLINSDIATAAARFLTMLVLDGAVYKYTGNALEEGPAGGGGGGTSDWTEDEKAAIRKLLGIPSSGTTPTIPTSGVLRAIKNKTDLITSQAAADNSGHSSLVFVNESMDNSFTQPTLELPEIPSDFEARAGTSRLDFLRAVFELLKSTRVAGIIQSSPQPYDLSTLQARIEQLESNPVPKMRSVLKDGVTDASIIVAFEDIGTTDYFVNVVPITEDTNINTFTWSVVDNSQQTNQVTIRVDGNASTYKLLVNIIEKI